MPVILTNNSRILLFFPSGIGDVVRNLGLVNALASAYPGAQIDVALVKPAAAKALAYNTHVHNIFRIHMDSYTPASYLKYFAYRGWRDVAELRRRKYDAILSTTVNPLRRFLIGLSGVKQIVVLPHSGSSSIEEYKILSTLDVKLSNEHFFNNQLKLADITPREYVRFAINPGKPNILVNMFCADSPDSIRDWDKWGDLVVGLSEWANPIVVGQAAFDYRKKYPLDYSKVVDLINRTDMNELIWLVRRSQTVVTVDSFIFHLAYALNQRVVGLFGPVNPAHRVPPLVDPALIITLYNRPACSPCITTKQINYCHNRQQPNVCMRSIQTDDVLWSIKKLLP